MRLDNLGGSGNVEDRRGQRTGGYGGRVAGGGGILLFAIVIIASFYGIDLSPMLGGGGGAIVGGGQTQSTLPPAEEEQMAKFTSVVLRTTEETWGTIFRQQGLTYTPPKLVLYTGVTETACSYGQAAMGPFYCPEDETVYVDMAFYQELRDRMGGGGDFAQGYVLAHEVGHHVQHLAGLDAQVRRLQSRVSEADANRLSVRMELQADCYAGVWGRAMQDRGILEGGDIEEAMRTAEAIGDDNLQRQTTGRVVPDSFTHGTSKERLGWFMQGFNSGSPASCNTFADVNLR
ncbi:MAG: neutral zinc metallopeptidase [Planctomycetaceae bacterium]|nr:neutral zinc metallopeptidase [Planctomycetaceae bacterium]